MRQPLQKHAQVSKSEIQALRDTAAKLESESKKIGFDPALEALLLDVYAVMRPRPNDYEQRRILVQIFNIMAKDVFGNSSGFPVVEVFGSFVMDLFTAKSDLDLSVNFSNDSTTDFPREKKIAVLRKFAQALYAHQRGGRVSGVQPILTARVPVLKVVDCGCGIECDISVENKDGWSRSIILSIVSPIDDRFRILSYLMKGWAKAQNINSSKDHTMNSLSIVSLVAFHLQTRDPPILPPFSALLKGGMNVASVKNNAPRFNNFGRTNRESVAELFEALLCKLLSVESLWQHGLCASTYEGLWICKTWKKKGVGNMSVEDFLDRSENFARSVGKAEIKKIYKCIRTSLKHLSRFKTGQIEASKLKSLLFGSIHLNEQVDQFVHDEGMEPKRRYPFYDSDAALNLIPVKRARNSEVHRETYHGCYETPIVSSGSSIAMHPLRIPQDNGGLHYSGHPFVPGQSDYSSQYNLLPPIASQLQWQPQFTTELGYGSQHQFLPLIPVRLHHESQLHQYDQNLVAARTWRNG